MLVRLCGVAALAGRTAQREVLRAATRLPAEQFLCGVDCVLGHLAVCRELPAGDGDDTVRGSRHLVTAAEVCGATALGVLVRLHQRTEPRPHAEYVVHGHTCRDTRVQCVEHVLDVVFGALGVVDRSLVVGIGRADVGVHERAVTLRHPRDHKQAPAVFRDGDDDGDVVAHLVPRHSEVHALCGADRVGVHLLVERADIVGPHAGCVDHDACARGERAARHLVTEVNGVHAIRALHRSDTAVVGHCGAVIGSGACDGQGEACIVGFCVVIEVRGRESPAVHCGKVSERGTGAEPAVDATDAPPAGEVVHPHCRTQCTRDLAGDDAVLREDRDHEGEHVHEVRGIAAEALAFVQRLVDQAHVALLEVTEAAVHEFR